VALDSDLGIMTLKNGDYGSVKYSEMCHWKVHRWDWY